METRCGPRCSSVVLIGFMIGMLSCTSDHSDTFVQQRSYHLKDVEVPTDGSADVTVVGDQASPISEELPIPREEPMQPSRADLRERFVKSYAADVVARSEYIVTAEAIGKDFQIFQRELRGRLKRVPMKVAHFTLERVIRGFGEFPGEFSITYEEGSHSMIIVPGYRYLLAVRLEDGEVIPVAAHNNASVPVQMLMESLGITLDELVSALNAELAPRSRNE